MPEETPSTGPWPHRLALIVGGIGLAVLVFGYGLDWAWLRQPVPGASRMRSFTALTLALCGLGLACALRPGGPTLPRRLCRAAVVVLGLTAVAGGIGGAFASFGWTVHPDRQLSPHLSVGLACVLLGVWTLLGPRTRRAEVRLVQWLAIPPALTAFPTLVCLPLGPGRALEYDTLTRLAPHTAVALMAAAAALFLARPEPGTPAALLLGQSIASRVTRRLLLVAVLLPPLSALGERFLVGDQPGALLHIGLFAYLQSIGLVGLTAIIGTVLHRSERARDQAERQNAAAQRQVERQAAILQQEVARRTSELSRTLLFNQRLALVASRTTNGVLITNAAGTIEWVNEGFTRITGYGFEEVLGRRPGRLLQGPATDPETVNFMRERLRAGQGFEVEVLNYTRDGREYWQALEVQPMRDPAGQLIGFTGISSDITARREAELRLRQAKDEAEQLNVQLEQAIARAQQSAIEANLGSQAKSAFLATMSHEIRTPLNGVIGMASLLRDTQLDEQQLDFVRTIETSGDALLTIINDILDYSKIEAGRIELEHAPFDLRQCVEDALDLFAAKAADKQLELVCRIGPAVPNAVLGDVTRLRQVIVNLVGNALKFTARGQVIVSLEATVAPGGRRELHFAVADSGIGIPADRVDRLFQPFSQVDSSTTRKYGGSGLGLAISRRLAEAMGGRMWVESEPGRGSTFHFTVLATEEVLPERPAWQVSPELLAGRRVLIAAGNAPLRDWLAEYVTAWGGAAVTVADAAEIRPVLGGRDPCQFVLIDRAFGRPAGWAGPALVRALPGGADLPVVVLEFPSATPLEPGLTARLPKPLKPAAMFEVLRRLARDLVRAPAAAAVEPPLSAAEPSGAVPMVNDLKVLVVEDNPVNQRVALMLLGKLGYAARLAQHGAEAVAACAAEPADLIFMDMEMPVMDGCEATRRIRAAGGPPPWIAALTANALPADRLRATAAGMNDFVAKPIRLTDLAGAIARARAGLRGRPAVAELATASPADDHAAA